MPSAAVGLHRSEPACGRLFGPPWAGWECYGGRWSLEGRTRPDILDPPVGFLRRAISLCSSFPSTTAAADPPSGFKMLRSIASRASRLARSTACKPPGFCSTDEPVLKESTKGSARSLPSLPYRYGSRHGPVGFDGLPVAVDWHMSGVVSAARDQSCTDSCWAHAAAAAVESLNALKTGVLKTLSVQQLRECCNVSSSEGTTESGGSAASAFDYIVKNGGLVPEEVYPFKIKMDVLYKHIECDAVTLDACTYIDDGNEEYLKKLVAQCPVCVSVAADEYFEFSDDKILFGSQCDLNLKENLGLLHSLLVVGYGLIDGIPVWIVKNSWGKGWGDKGFRYIIRGFGAFGIGQVISVPRKHSRNSVCIVKSEFDMALGKGKRWWLKPGGWPRFKVDVGQLENVEVEMLWSEEND